DGSKERETGHEFLLNEGASERGIFVLAVRQAPRSLSTFDGQSLLARAKVLKGLFELPMVQRACFHYFNNFSTRVRESLIKMGRSVMTLNCPRCYGLTQYEDFVFLKRTNPRLCRGTSRV
ncbi:MAG: hypothetical protein J5861_01475, partial [Desulfovibrio sp.]|nr:hypothetical protein [Desulfovibrio sp.]